MKEYLADQLKKPTGIPGRLLAGLWNRRNQALNDDVFQALDIETDDKILEIGFGGGYLIKKIAKNMSEGLCIGIDHSQTVVSRGRKQFEKLIKDNRIQLKVASAEKLPFPDNYFTKVCSVNSIFYWSDPEKVISECKRILVDKGLLILCFTCRESIENKSFAPFIRIFDTNEISSILGREGFQSAVRENVDSHRKYLLIEAKL